MREKELGMAFVQVGEENGAPHGFSATQAKQFNRALLDFVG